MNALEPDVNVDECLSMHAKLIPLIRPHGDSFLDSRFQNNAR